MSRRWGEFPKARKNHPLSWATQNPLFAFGAIALVAGIVVLTVTIVRDYVGPKKFVVVELFDVDEKSTSGGITISLNRVTYQPGFDVRLSSFLRKKSNPRIIIDGEIANDSSDPIVRLWVITALADTRAVEAVELFVSSLARSDWRERAAAIRGLTRVRSKSSIGPLIERLDLEEGRLKGDALEALRALTGRTFVGNPERWREWWSASKDRFRLPDTVAVGAAPPHSRRVIYCLDISSSMTGAKLKAAKQWLLEAVEGLPRGARFDVIFFNHRIRRWNRKTSESLADALGTLRNGGQTNLFGALETALQDPEADTVTVISDGAPSAGAVVEPEEILRRIRRLNRTRQITIHGVSKTPTEFLKRLAAENGGRIIVN